MFRYLNILKFKYRPGQGLLEVVVAIGVLSTGVFSAVTLMTSGLNAALEAEARLKASNLAREGVEAARSIRDSNWLQSNVWDAGLVGPGFDYNGAAIFDADTGIWSIDFDLNNISDADALFRVGADGLFRQASSGTDTHFRRLITLSPICLDSVSGVYTIIQLGICSDKKVGAEIKSEVVWNVGARTHKMSFVENLYDWK